MKQLLDHATRLGRAGRAGWHRFSHFAQNCIIGILIEVVILTVEFGAHPAALVWLQNTALDAMMRGAASQYMIEQGDAAKARPLVYLDIDERTWRRTR